MRGNRLSKEIASSKDSYSLGALFLFLEIVVGTSIVAIIKYFSNDVSLSVVLMFRYIFCLPILLLVGLKIGGLKYFKIKRVSGASVGAYAGLLYLIDKLHVYVEEYEIMKEGFRETLTLEKLEQQLRKLV